MIGLYESNLNRVSVAWGKWEFCSLFLLPPSPSPPPTSPLQKGISTQLVKQPTRLAKKTIEAFKQITETMSPNLKNNRAAS